MPKMARLVALVVALTFFLVGSSENTQSQSSYPSKPIRLVVPYPPGGPVDIVARIVGEALGPALGQSVYVDNRGGANGSIGSAVVAKADPDGYTLLMGSAGPLTVNPAIYQTMSYDVIKDFAAVGLVGTVPQILVVTPSLKITSCQQLFSYAKQNPGKLTFASAGFGSMQFVAGELLKQSVGIDMLHVPYQGAAPAMIDLLGARVSIMVDLMPTSRPHILDGALKALAVTTPQRIPSFPDVPTLQECGVKDFNSSSWFGVVAPAKTPAHIIETLNTKMAKVLSSPTVQQLFEKQGVQPVTNSPAEFSTFLSDEITKWKRVMGAAHVQIK